MDKAPNLIGEIFGRLRVIERAESSKKGQSSVKNKKIDS